MKKLKLGMTLSTILAVSILATGCGRVIEVKNGSKVAVSMEDYKYTATEYYEKIKEDNISTLIDMMDKDFLGKKYKTEDKETKEIDSQIKQMKKSVGGSEETFLSAIKQYFGADSENELKEMLSLEYKRKVAVEDYIKENLKESEIKKYYEESIYGEVEASHILITVDVEDSATEEEKTAADNTAKETAQNIIKELNEGKSFEDLAKQYSKDTANASNGGKLGYFDVNTMEEEFKNEVLALKVNEYSKEPIKTRYGYHIVLKTGQKEKPELKEVEDKIKDTLTTNKLNENNAVYYESLKSIREKNKLTWNDDVLKESYNKYMNNLIENAKNS